jgi:molybdopterin molybdotransferase
MAEPDIPQRIARLTPLADVLLRLEALVGPVSPQASELSTALGATLAEDVLSAVELPAVARALRDGWAVPSDLTNDAGGYAPAPLPAAHRVNAGEPLPPGTDAVAPLDAVIMRGGLAHALAPITAGEGVLAAGTDAASGAALMRAGRRLDRPHIALLRLAGIARVSIRVPRLRLMGGRAQDDSVIDTALTCIADAIAAMGGIAVGGEPTELAGALTDAAVDAVIVVGGTGNGRNDKTVETLASLGEVYAHGIALRPGETTALGAVSGRPVLAVPGRLDAALAAWHLLGRVMLARLAGGCEALPSRTAKLTHKIASTVGLSELVPVRCDGLLATPIGSGYLPLSALAQADGWILIAPDSEGYPEQSDVVVRPWP